LNGISPINGIIITDYKYLPDQTTLEEAIRALEKVDYGIITGKGDKIECLVTAEVLTDLLKKTAIDGAKTTLWKLRRQWPPMDMVSLEGQDGFDENYSSVRIDATTRRSGSKGFIFVKDKQVKCIMAFKGAPLADDLGEVLVKSLDIFDDLSFRDLGGPIGVDCTKYCKICGEKVTYHSYSSDAPPTCPNGHKLIF